MPPLDKHEIQKHINGTLKAMLENCNNAEYNQPEAGRLTKHKSEIKLSEKPRTKTKEKMTGMEEILKRASTTGKQSSRMNSPTIDETDKREASNRDWTSLVNDSQARTTDPPTSKPTSQTDSNPYRIGS